MNGIKLKELRENKNLYQKELASKLGISSSTIGMYEQGRREPDNSMLKIIANFFGVTVDYLLDNDDKKQNILNEKDIIKNFLVDAGYMNKNDILTLEEINKIKDFLLKNKDYIKAKK